MSAHKAMSQDLVSSWGRGEVLAGKIEEYYGATKVGGSQKADRTMGPLRQFLISQHHHMHALDDEMALFYPSKGLLFGVFSSTLIPSSSRCVALHRPLHVRNGDRP